MKYRNWRRSSKSVTLGIIEGRHTAKIITKTDIPISCGTVDGADEDEAED